MKSSNKLCNKSDKCRLLCHFNKMKCHKPSELVLSSSADVGTACFVTTFSSSNKGCSSSFFLKWNRQKLQCHNKKSPVFSCFECKFVPMLNNYTLLFLQLSEDTRTWFNTSEHILTHDKTWRHITFIRNLRWKFVSVSGFENVRLKHVNQ